MKHRKKHNKNKEEREKDNKKPRNEKKTFNQLVGTIRTVRITLKIKSDFISPPYPCIVCNTNACQLDITCIVSGF